MKITLKESELRGLIENKVRKVLSETELSYQTETDPIYDNVTGMDMRDWLQERYPDEMDNGIWGYESIMADLANSNELSIEIINFFINNATKTVEGWVHNLKKFKERCEQYKNHYNIH